TRGEEFEGGYDLRAEHRVPPHQLPLVRVEAAGLAEHAFRNPDLADVVKKSGLRDDVSLSCRRPRVFGEAPPEDTHPLRVATRIRIFRFESIREAEKRLADRPLRALIEVPDVLGVAQTLLVRGVQTAIGRGQVARAGG